MLLQSQNKPHLTPNQPAMVAMAKQTVCYNPQTGPHLKLHPTTTTTTNQEILNTLPYDGSSEEGKFGWARLMDNDIPYLLRAQEKFVSLHIMQYNKVFETYRKFFSDDIFRYLQIQMYKMTAAEAKLLNEINNEHSDSGFGALKFTMNDDLISLKDATGIQNFLHFCYNKLIINIKIQQTVCGFIRINRQNYIPYVWQSCKQYVPLFYIDGECEYLKERAIELGEWPLAYMKLCCRIHGVSKPVYGDKSMTVVELELVKKFFPPGTPFEDSWPEETKAECLLRPNRTNKPKGNSSTVNRTNIENAPTHNIQVVPQKATSPYKNIDYTKQPRDKFATRTPPPYSAIKKKLVKFTQNVFRPDSGKSTVAVQNPVSLPNSATNQLKQINEKSSQRNFQIPDFDFPAGSSPYSFSRAQFGSKFLNLCINLMPFDFTTKLVTLEEITCVSQIPMDCFQKAIRSLEFDIFLPNDYQSKLLASCGMHPTSGLLEVHKVVSSMNNIRNACYKLSLKR